MLAVRILFIGCLFLLTNWPCRHTYALQALQHAILLVPQNSFYVLLGAEAAYRAIDIPLASQMFLQVIDMADDGHDSATPPLSALTVRAWYGLRLVRLVRSLT
jgi:hypothetical protein